MKKTLNKIHDLWKEEHVMYITTSSAVALFILFFQPFSSHNLDSHYNFSHAVAIACIVFFIMFLVRNVCCILRRNNAETQKESFVVFKINVYVIWLLSSVICSLYLFYAELISMSLFLVFKVALICLVPPLILLFNRKMHDLKQNNELLVVQGSLLSHKLDNNDDSSHRFIEFNSMNGDGNFSLLLSKILFVKSADNYVEIHYLEGAQHKMKLMRNTLRNIETEFKGNPQFIRCHRSCIVNINCVAKFDTNCSTHNLTMKGSDQAIPVSRQYVSKIKKAL